MYKGSIVARMVVRYGDLSHKMTSSHNGKGPSVTMLIDSSVTYPMSHYLPATTFHIDLLFENYKLVKSWVWEIEIC